MARGDRRQVIGRQTVRQSGSYFPDDVRAASELQEQQRASRWLEAARSERKQRRLATD